MTKKHQFAGLVAVLVLVFGFGVILLGGHAAVVKQSGVSEVALKPLIANVPSASASQAAPSSESSPSANSASTGGGIPMSDVAAHATSSSCWTTINSSVYDLTTWIPRHPGGAQRILSLCGKDGTNDYNRQHGRSRSVQNMLAMFKIGELTP